MTVELNDFIAEDRAAISQTSATRRRGLAMNHVQHRWISSLLIVAGLCCALIVTVDGIAQGQPLRPDRSRTPIERIGMIESTDRGASWKFKGHADFHATALNPVDPSALFDNGALVLYFLDLVSLGTDTAVIYRALATDSSGMDFFPPARAYALPGDFTDPAVVRLPSGAYRMYLHTNSDVISATSTDGRFFTPNTGVRTFSGGVPGALVLPDGRVRLFVCSQGITSLISDDGLAFSPEPGVRIPLFPGAAIVADPHPLRSNVGTYFMVYKVRPTGPGDVETEDVYLAQSVDGFSWTPGSSPLVKGRVPTLVELPDGRLRIYYVDFQPDEPAGLFKFVKSIQVTPDAKFPNGGFARINHVPAIDRFVVTFGSDNGYAYKQYTMDMVEDGKSGYFWSGGADMGSRMIDNTYYFAVMHNNPGQSPGWHIAKYDAVSWNVLDSIDFPLDFPKEESGDPLVAMVDGHLDVSGQYNALGSYPPLDVGAASFHYFFTPNLDSVGKRILADTAHIVGASMIQVEGITYYVTANAFSGDLIMMKYDSQWHYLGMKALMKQAHFSTGLAFDGFRFYLAYIDTRQRTSGKFPWFLNVRLAAFDRDWNLLEDIAVTNYTPADNMQTGRPWVVLHGDRLYVSYDLDTRDSVTHEEDGKGQAIVCVYELRLTSTATRPPDRVPDQLWLEQNYPNPFNPLTTIRYGLPQRSHVSLTVYNTLGQQVSELVGGEIEAGSHEVKFDAAGLPSGVYFYRLKARHFVQTRTLLLLR